MKLKLFYLFALFSFTLFGYSQSQMTVIDPFEDLIDVKTKFNATIGVADRWKFQSFSGTLDAAKVAYVDFRKEFRQIDATIVFAEPHYKVWAGNTRTRMECERLMDETKKTITNSFLVKPKN